jgi:hypothetical protein
MLRKDYNSTKDSKYSEQMQKATPKWKELFEISFTDEMKEKYLSYWKVG